MLNMQYIYQHEYAAIVFSFFQVTNLFILLSSPSIVMGTSCGSTFL